jgi:hypothetical protein
MKRKTKMIMIGIAICVVLALVFVFLTGVIGVSANNLEDDARKSHKIDSAWDMNGSSNDGIAAFIFFNDTHDHHTFSIYLTRAGLSFGYFFREGGSSSIILNGILMFTYGENGSAIVSMNKNRAAKIVYGDSNDATEILVDPAKPFAAVVPANCGSIALYSADGIEIPITVIEQRS